MESPGPIRIFTANEAAAYPKTFSLPLPDFFFNFILLQLHAGAK